MASASALTAVVERLIEQTRKKWKVKDETVTIFKKPPSPTPRLRKSSKRKSKLLN